MNISTKLKGLFAIAVAAVGMTAVADPSVTIDKVESVKPWVSATGAITVDYTLGGIDADGWYKVAFDVTAKNETKGVTNAAAKLTDGAATKEIDTAALFGKQVVDTKAKVKVSLIALKPKDPPPAGQLWANGPIWAECNVGATKPEEYGILTNFNDAAQAVTDALGKDWRLPTKEEFEALCSNCEQKWDELNGVKGRFFTGKGDYSSNSIFLPAAGYGDSSGRRYAGSKGYYWSSTGKDAATYAWNLYFGGSGDAYVDYEARSKVFSVRAVRSAE